jgi:hypothetical protein
MTNQSVVNAIMNNTDGVTKFQTTIDSDHRYIHEGIGFELPVTTATINAAGTYYISLKPAAGCYVHLKPTKIWSSANILKYELYEGSTIDAAGDVATPVNKNRNSTTVSKVTCKTAATTTVDGTLLDIATVDTGGTPSSSSGGAIGGGTDEIVLKPNTQYTVKLTNIGLTTATVGYLGLFWYEETTGVSS